MESIASDDPDVGTRTPDFGSGYCGIRLLSGIYKLSDSSLYQNFTTTGSFNVATVGSL